MSEQNGSGPSERWIVIPRWDGPEGFQHYKDRDPTWIKVYPRLLSDDTYMALSPHLCAILHRLWLEYARSGCQLAANTASLTRRLGLRVTSLHLESLNHAGFITFSASRPLAPRARSREEETETEEQQVLGSSDVYLSKAVNALDQNARGNSETERPRELTHLKNIFDPETNT